MAGTPNTIPLLLLIHIGRGWAAIAQGRDGPIWHWQQEQTMISPGLTRGETKIQPRESHA